MPGRPRETGPGQTEECTVANTAELVKELRERTGAGILDCKKALTENKDDLEKASDWLREKGIAKAAKKSGRIAAEGKVGSYIHAGGKIGVLLELNCETDFVARNEQFDILLKDIAMHIAATAPLVVSSEEVPAAEIERERQIFAAQALESGKPANVIEKMVQGRIEKFIKEVSLLDQPFVKDTGKTVGQLINESIAVIGEKISVRRFIRWQMGEGLEKRQDDFAAEVAAQASGKAS